MRDRDFVAMNHLVVVPTEQNSIVHDRLSTLFPLLGVVNLTHGHSPIATRKPTATITRMNGAGLRSAEETLRVRGINGLTASAHDDSNETRVAQ